MLVYWYQGPDGDLIDLSGHCEKWILDVTENAEEGSVAVCTVLIDDPLGELDIIGHRYFAIEETEAEDDEDRFVFVGFTGAVTIVRGPNRTGPGRQFSVELGDVNVILSRRVMVGTDNDRPIETDVARVEWVVSTAESNTIDDTRYLLTGDPISLDANDYLLQTGESVYSDCSQASGKNYFLTYFGDVGVTDFTPWGEIALWYGHPGESDYPSAASITNVLAEEDPDNGVFCMSVEDSSMNRDYMRIYSRVFVPYKQSYQQKSSIATAVRYTRRDAVMTAPNVKTAAKALARATRYVDDLKTPEDRATVTLSNIPRAKVNAIRPGMLVPVKATHWPAPYNTTAQDMRVLSRRVHDISDSDQQSYELTLVLSRSVPPEAFVCVSGDFDPTASGSYPPLGSATTDSDAVVYYASPGHGPPNEPTPGWVGGWNFAEFHGPGGPDYAGDCATNSLILLFVGPGSATVHTTIYTQPRVYIAQMQYYGPGGIWVTLEEQTGSFGDDIAFEVPDDGQCFHRVTVVDTGTPCGDKWGFEGVDWVSTA